MTTTIRPSSRLPRLNPVWLLVDALVLAGFLLCWRLVWPLTSLDASIRLPWPLLAAVFFATEAWVVHVHFRKEAHTLSLNEIPIVLGLFLVTPRELILAQLVGAGLALVAYRRQRLLKVLFNLALFVCSTSLTLIVFHAVASASAPLGARSVFGAFVGSVAASLTSVVLVAAAIRLSEHTSSPRELMKIAVVAAASTLANVSLALAGVKLLAVDRLGAGLLFLPMAICVFAFRAYGTQRSRHEHLEFLYASMRSVQHAPNLELAVGELLRAARWMLRADYSELILLSSADGQTLRSVLSDRESLMGQSELRAPERHALEFLVAGDGAVLLPRGRHPHELDGFLATRGLRDAVLTILRGEERVLGLLIVGERSSEVSSFVPEDKRLLTTFASHAGILLENNRLEQALEQLTELQEQLEHQAYHDALTGLANRALVTSRVTEALEAPGAGEDQDAAVIFVDLDDFKIINDSLGHAAGDALLVEVAARIAACVRPGDLPARLGGDEFAILLGPAKPEEAELVGRRILAALREPIALPGRHAAVHASIGIALAGEDTPDADTLLRNADVAMYSAKAEGKRQVAFYTPEMHRIVRTRHDVAVALERAIDGREIEAHFQPIVSLTDGSIVGFEALARWRHSNGKLVHPEAFISLAEETGMMIPIGREILRQGCEQAAEWSRLADRPGAFDVAVNLSLTELRDPRLVENVAATLGQTGLDPGSLILEVTESAAMREPTATIATMLELRGIGIRLALDDFGTGYSSLSHLHDLPIDRLKIAKPFVEPLREAAARSVLADTIVGLSSSLHLECVAEGIEHPRQAERLRNLGCGMGQGYMFGRPVDGDAIRARILDGNTYEAALKPAAPFAEAVRSLRIA